MQMVTWHFINTAPSQWKMLVISKANDASCDRCHVAFHVFLGIYSQINPIRLKDWKSFRKKLLTVLQHSPTRFSMCNGRCLTSAKTTAANWLKHSVWSFQFHLHINKTRLNTIDYDSASFNNELISGDMSATTSVSLKGWGQEVHTVVSEKLKSCSCFA